MKKDQYEDLRKLVLPECHIADDFFMKSSETEKICYYMFSTMACKFLFVDDNYESFTGYLFEVHKKGGLDFWFSKTHPDDRKMLADRILEFQGASKSSFKKESPPSGILNYRFLKGSDEWIWIQHVVYVVSIDSNGVIDKMVHRMRLLDVLSFSANLKKRPFEISLDESGQPPVNTLTNREKQVLKLIGEGFSSKIIADKLSISINTVETHRRHLLEKLKAKNSMELVKQAFRLFWN